MKYASNSRRLFGDAWSLNISPDGYLSAWCTSGVIALIFAPLVIALKNDYPWVIAVPIIVGGAIIAFAELKRCGLVGGSESGWWNPVDAPGLGWVAAAGVAAICLLQITLATGLSPIYSNILSAVLAVLVLESIKASAIFAFKSGRANEREHSIVFKSLHSMTHITRDLITNVMFVSPEGLPRNSVGSLVEFSNCISKCCSELIDSNLTFRVTVKAFASHYELVTIARDEVSLQQASPSQDQGVRLSIKDNTAFAKLLSKHERAFASDNLLALPDYENTSKDWQERYTATIVVPIRKHLADSDKFELVGFISVDCLRAPLNVKVFCGADGQPDEALCNLLYSFADAAYVVIKRGRALRSRQLKQPESFILDEVTPHFAQMLHENFVARAWIQVKPPLGD